MVCCWSRESVSNVLCFLTLLFSEMRVLNEVVKDEMREDKKRKRKDGK